MSTIETRAPAHRIPSMRVAAPRPPQVDRAAPSTARSWLRRVRAWMVVLPVDALMLIAPVAWTPEQWKSTGAMAVLSVALITGGNRYRARLHVSVLDELPSLITRILTASAAVALVIAFRHEHAALVTFLVNVGISIGLLVVGRVVTTQLIVLGRRSRVTLHRTVLVGGGPLARALAQTLQNEPRYGLGVVGFVDDGDGEEVSPLVPRLGRVADLGAVVVRTGADVILVTNGTFGERQLHDAVRAPACLGCDLLVVPRMHYFHTLTGLSDHIGSIPVMRVRTPALRGPARVVKRAFDIVVATTSLVLLAPLLAACALAVRLEGGPGIIFRQPRVGRDGVVFDCLKFRSMKPADETESATQWSIAADDRVGPVGRFLRRTSFDELPQLWNILRGDMTLVGPRPERPHFVDRFSEEFDRYAHRHRVQAGLTGFAQVSGLRGNTSIAERAMFDNYYIENWTLWLDIKIILRTFGEVLFARGR